MMKFLRWLFVIPEPKPRVPNVRKKWLPMWSHDAKWVDKDNNVLHTLTYVLRYYPDTHTVKLKCFGYEAKDHHMYNHALKMYHNVMVWLNKYDREDAIKWINENYNKTIHGEASMTDPEKLSIPELEKLIQEKLELEEYKEVAKLQSIIEKKSKE